MRVGCSVLTMDGSTLQMGNDSRYTLRAKFILGFSLFMGLSVPQHFNNYVVTTGKGPVHSRSTWFNELSSSCC
ncbi:hypothetical protein L1987_35721 [Smallanthus sonchifolius]|uniref:Uncharacterized protein n=1 Tax=Smallanthus sonchifolius TaxID=185202 RepID=A0ACB9HCE1_9ASTR|nr:hypothetical protein L1987_35721 [Smallanthus sonchifolius]